MIWPVSVCRLSDSESLRQAEVGDLGHSVGVEQHVGRLQVAVHDPGLVRGMNGPGQGRDEAGSGSSRLGRTRESRVEASALEELERHEWQAVRFADVIEFAGCWGAGAWRPPRPRSGSGPADLPAMLPADDHLERDKPIEPLLAEP